MPNVPGIAPNVPWITPNVPWITLNVPWTGDRTDGAAMHGARRVSVQMFPESNWMFPESHRMFPESRRMFPESLWMFPEQVIAQMERRCMEHDEYQSARYAFCPTNCPTNCTNCPMAQSIKPRPPSQQLCFIGRSQSRTEFFQEIVIAGWNKVVGVVAYVLPIVSNTLCKLSYKLDFAFPPTMATNKLYLAFRVLGFRILGF
jgi:hypothetical protein